MKNDTIGLNHGAGGILTHTLLRELIFPAFSNPILDQGNDAGVFRLRGDIACTTDSFVVHPVFFPGGDIGKLSVCGTINDLAVMAATPKFITVACIIEEGFGMRSLKKIVGSIARACAGSGVQVIGGDFKVVEKGAADGIFINTTGIGVFDTPQRPSGGKVAPGDAVIISGQIGEHGTAIMNSRNDYKLSVPVKSDCAALDALIRGVLKTGCAIHAMRDPTRGGVATTLNEIALQSGTTIVLQEDTLPIPPPVRGFCDLLGIDPLYMANEGKVLIFVKSRDAQKVLLALHKDPLGRNARIIGHVETAVKQKPAVLMSTSIGSTRIVPMLTGEQLPRIC
jgi:hydrogenase expression/formation protein HypE